MAKVKWSPDAILDLLKITDYINEQTRLEGISQGIINEIKERIQLLQGFPMLGPLLELNSKSAYRYLVCGNYVVIYQVIGNDVYIVKVAYKRENYIRLFINDNDCMVHEDVLFFDDVLPNGFSGRFSGR